MLVLAVDVLNNNPTVLQLPVVSARFTNATPSIDAQSVVVALNLPVALVAFQCAVELHFLVYI